MTRDEIIKLAREAGFVDESFCRWGAYSDDLERFAALVEQQLIASGYRKCAAGQRTSQFCGQLEQAVLAEREAICPIVYGHCGSDNDAQRIVDAIRARGEK